MKFSFAILFLLFATLSSSYSQVIKKQSNINEPTKRSGSISVAGGVWLAQDKDYSGLFNFALAHEAKIADYFFILTELSQMNFAFDNKENDILNSISSTNTFLGLSVLAGIDDYSISAGVGTINSFFDNVNVLLQINVKLYGSNNYNIEGNMKYTGDFKDVLYYAMFIKIVHKLN